MEKLRVGVIGAGMFACFRHIPDLLGTGEVELTAVCRRDPAALAKVADHFGITGRYTDYRAMLDDALLDAVVVSSPHGLHYEHTRAALDCGLPVLSDKPLAVTSAQAEALRDLAATKGLALLVASIPAFNGLHRYFRECIARGSLGTLHLIQLTALSNIDSFGFFGHGTFPEGTPYFMPPTAFRASPKLGGGGFFQDHASHAVAGILVTTGLRPVEVTASFDDYELDMRPSVTIRFDTGALAVLTYAGNAFPDIRDLRAFSSTLYVGTAGSLSMDSRTGKTYFQAWGQDLEEVPVEALPPNSSPAENFVGMLRGREAPLLPVEVSVQTVRLIEAAYRSAREGGTVRLG